MRPGSHIYSGVWISFSQLTRECGLLVVRVECDTGSFAGGGVGIIPLGGREKVANVFFIVSIKYNV